MITFSEIAAQGYTKRKFKNRLMCLLFFVAALVALTPLFSIMGYVFIKGVGSINWSFLTQLPAPVGESGGGMANALVGTCVLIVLASIIGMTSGLATGIYLSEYGRGKLATIIRFSADMLSSVPSIVIGLFVYILIVRPMQSFSALAGGVALGVIMIPTIARSAEELLKLVPASVREAGLALGLPRWKVTIWIVLKGSLSGIITGVMLAIARVAGETAPLLFTALGNRFWSWNLTQPIGSLPVQIFTYSISPFEEWHRQAWAGALVLVLLVFSINLGARFVFRPQISRD
ncbi:MAG: phosphate ABC transporter permease PstA [Deltaproteobacteria bacterium]|nr:phosphate ABC transporter permease PstA [Deltaproteobacteria bacterium]